MNRFLVLVTGLALIGFGSSPALAQAGGVSPVHEQLSALETQLQADEAAIAADRSAIARDQSDSMALGHDAQRLSADMKVLRYDRGTNQDIWGRDHRKGT